MRTLLKNSLLDGKPTAVLCEDAKIAAILDPAEPVAADEVIDCEGATLLPGLVDIHSHGCIGFDTMDGRDLESMADFYEKNGVTTWYPTTLTESHERLLATLSAKTDFDHGAHIPGFHLEGPYINLKYKGAQNEKYVRRPDREEFALFPKIKRVTIAPETEGALDFIKNCKSAQISLGHTDTDYTTALEAFRLGATSLTHTCNAMPPLLHRAPGPIGAAAVAGAYAEVICDGLHIAEGMIVCLYRIFGAEKMILVSDSMHATGLADGVFEFGGQPVHVVGGVARTESGALAGSTATLFGCVRQAMRFGIPAKEAFAMASRNPARLMGIKKGEIAVGYDADFILVDGEYNLQKTVIVR